MTACPWRIGYARVSIADRKLKAEGCGIGFRRSRDGQAERHRASSTRCELVVTRLDRLERDTRDGFGALAMWEPKPHGPNHGSTIFAIAPRGDRTLSPRCSSEASTSGASRPQSPRLCERQRGVGAELATTSPTEPPRRRPERTAESGGCERVLQRSRASVQGAEDRLSLGRRDDFPVVRDLG